MPTQQAKSKSKPSHNLRKQIHKVGEMESNQARTATKWQLTYIFSIHRIIKALKHTQPLTGKLAIAPHYENYKARRATSGKNPTVSQYANKKQRQKKIQTETIPKSGQ